MPGDAKKEKGLQVSALRMSHAHQTGAGRICYRDADSAGKRRQETGVDEIEEAAMKKNFDGVIFFQEAEMRTAGRKSLFLSDFVRMIWREV